MSSEKEKSQRRARVAKPTRTKPARTKPATLADVAAMAGVVPMTASRALNRSGYVSADVRERVAAAARALAYRPNMLARQLRGSRLHAVGIMLPDIANPFAAELMKGITPVLRAAGFTGFIATAGQSVEDETRGHPGLCRPSHRWHAGCHAGHADRRRDPQRHLRERCADGYDRAADRDSRHRLRHRRPLPGRVRRGDASYRPGAPADRFYRRLGGGYHSPASLQGLSGGAAGSGHHARSRLCGADDDRAGVRHGGGRLPWPAGPVQAGTATHRHLRAQRFRGHWRSARRAHVAPARAAGCRHRRLRQHPYRGLPDAATHYSGPADRRAGTHRGGASAQAHRSHQQPPPDRAVALQAGRPRVDRSTKKGAVDAAP